MVLVEDMMEIAGADPLDKALSFVVVRVCTKKFIPWCYVPFAWIRLARLPCC
jgi:hypothetical protein